MPKISIDDEAYWKFQELKVKLKARTWKELIVQIYNILAKRGDEKEEAKT